MQRELDLVDKLNKELNNKTCEFLLNISSLKKYLKLLNNNINNENYFNLFKTNYFLIILLMIFLNLNLVII